MKSLLTALFALSAAGFALASQWKIEPKELPTDAMFGTCVAAYDGWIASGAPRDDSGAVRSGAAYVANPYGTRGS